MYPKLGANVMELIEKFVSGITRMIIFSVEYDKKIMHRDALNSLY